MSFQCRACGEISNSYGSDLCKRCESEQQRHEALLSSEQKILAALQENNDLLKLLIGKLETNQK